MGRRVRAKDESPELSSEEFAFPMSSFALSMLYLSILTLISHMALEM